MNNFWHNLPKPFFILAPMEGVTDVVFRHIVAHAARPDVFFTEFTNATGWVAAGDRATGGRLIKTDDESPIVAQVWGADPEAMAKMSVHCAELDYQGIDINMGCPDASAIKTGGGAAMIREPSLAADMIQAAKASGLPVSIKTRLGYSKPEEWEAWLRHVFEQDIVNLTIHLRTKKEMSKVPAHFELIPAIRTLRDEIAPKTLLTINGDIRDRQHGEELVGQHGVDGVMIGRGVFSNPFVFEKKPRAHTHSELIDLLRLQLDLHDKYEQDIAPRKFDPLKRFFKIYIRDFHDASELREKLMQTKTTDEVREILSSFENGLRLDML